MDQNYRIDEVFNTVSTNLYTYWYYSSSLHLQHKSNCTYSFCETLFFQAPNTGAVTVPPSVTDLNEDDISGYLPQDKHFSTRALHSGYSPSDSDYMAVVPPIVLATTYEQLGPAVPKVSLFPDNAQYLLAFITLFDYSQKIVIDPHR